MTTQPNDGLLYLQDYPKLWKWVNRCVICGRLGYKPEMLTAESRPAGASNIRRYFPLMAVDESGKCDQCAAAWFGKNVPD